MRFNQIVLGFKKPISLDDYDLTSHLVRSDRFILNLIDISFKKPTSLDDYDLTIHLARLDQFIMNSTGLGFKSSTSWADYDLNSAHLNLLNLFIMNLIFLGNSIRTTLHRLSDLISNITDTLSSSWRTAYSFNDPIKWSQSLGDKNRIVDYAVAHFFNSSEDCNRKKYSEDCFHLLESSVVQYFD